MSTATAKKKGGKTAKQAVQDLKESMEKNLEPGSSVEINGTKIAEGGNPAGGASDSEVEDVAGQITEMIIGAIDGAEAESLPPEELAQKLAAEKDRLEKLMCKISAEMTEAQVEFNEANEEMKEKKKHLESVQLKINETVGKLTDVLEGRCRPNPQKELPFPESEIGGQSEMSPALWQSEPMTSLDLPKTLLAKLEQEGFTTVGTLHAELNNQRFANLDFGEKQITKIQNAVDFVVMRAEELAKEAAANAAAETSEPTEEQPQS